MNREVALNIIHLCRALRHLALDKSAIDPGNFLSILSHIAFQQDDEWAFILNAFPDALEFADLTLSLSYILDHSPLKSRFFTVRKEIHNRYKEIYNPMALQILGLYIERVSMKVCIRLKL